MECEMSQVHDVPDGVGPMTAGFNHVATLTVDLDRYVDFYRRVFGAAVISMIEARPDHPRMAIIDVGGDAHIGAFEVPASSIVGDRRQIGGRGPIDHFALAVSSMVNLEAVRDRLVAEGASSGEITDFGSGLSVFFRDPDGAELEAGWHKSPAPPTPPTH
jgi:catechol 2,3-dioxygenase-like lactoylglutathione lyase family enzyme